MNTLGLHYRKSRIHARGAMPKEPRRFLRRSGAQPHRAGAGGGLRSLLVRGALAAAQRNCWAGESRLNLIAHCFRFPMQYRNLLVRMKICPSEIAGELSA